MFLLHTPACASLTPALMAQAIWLDAQGWLT